MISEPFQPEFAFPGASRNKPRLILSVDDEPGVLYTRYRLLQRAGYDVVCANDGVQALQVFASHPVDLVLLDYAMPGMNGGEVAQEIKQSKPNVPVVLVSGSPVPDEALSWVDSYLPKAQGPELLLASIDRLLLAA